MLAPDDWRTYRDIRLAMLQESPEAFGSRYADAVGFDEHTWRGRLTSCDHHLAELDGRPVGSAGLGRRTARRSSSACGSTRRAGDGRWVPCSWRRCSNGPPPGVTTGCGSTWWTATSPARRLYERMGFVATGVVQEPPNTPGATESEMVRLL